MRYTLTFREQEYEELTAYLFSDDLVERAAYALCRLSQSDTETRLLVREIIPVQEEDILEATAVGMKIRNVSFLRAMKKADQTKMLFFFIHSHPKSYPQHSPQDDQEERPLFQTAYTRIRTPGVHGSLVLSSPERPIARVWLPDGTFQPVSLIRVLGLWFRFFSQEASEPLPQFFDRQIRAFGENFQRLLCLLHIGIVGVGGTGSAVKEQLTRLGIGTLTLFDGQRFETTNVNRVYGSTVHDEGREKVQLGKDSAETIGLGTQICPVNRPITFRSAAENLKKCDIIFGCTDDEWGRSILNKLAYYYHIPVFDMGVKIHSEEKTIRSIQGRVTTLLGGYACLSCRGRITSQGIKNESLAELDPEHHQELIRQGYAAELGEPAPAVIPFTTAVAAAAVTEMIHRLTGFMGEDRKSNETLLFFDETKVRTNHQLSKEGCQCGDPYYIMRGDVRPFLDLTWRLE